MEITACPNDSTDHILIRAETQQWEASSPGDILTLKWNRYKTGALGGQSFNNDPSRMKHSKWKSYYYKQSKKW